MPNSVPTASAAPLHTPDNQGLRILSGTSVFDQRPVELILPANGKTVAEILGQLRTTGQIDPLIIDENGNVTGGVDFTVWISDFELNTPQVEIPSCNWGKVRLKSGTSLAVGIRPNGGGGGGGKSPVRILLTIAVIAIAAYTGGVVAGWATEAGYSTAAAGALGAAAGAAVNAVGGILINSIAPPPTANLSASRGDYNRDALSPTWSLNGIQNDPDPYGPIPLLYGSNRIVPPRVTEFFTENVGDDVYARVTLCAGYGPMRFSEPRFGTTPLENFNDVQVEYREGWKDDDPITLFADQPQTDNYNIRIKDGPVVVESREADEIMIDYACPGLVYFDNNGNRQNRTVDLKIDVRRLGADEEFVSANSGAAPMNESSFLTRIFAPVGQRWVVYRTDYPVSGPITLTLFSRAGSYFGSSPLSGYQYQIYVRNYDPDRNDLKETSWPPESFQLYWKSSKIAPGGSETRTITPPVGQRLEIAVMLNCYWVSGGNPKWIPDNFPAADPTWMMYDEPEISYITNSENVERISLSITGATENPVRRTVPVSLPGRGRYEIRTRRLTPDSESTRVRDDLYLTGVKSILKEPPLQKKGLASISFRVKAGDQLQGLLDRFSVHATRLLPVYDRDTATWEWRETKNPAWAALWTLMGDAVAQPAKQDEIDLPTWLAFADFCARKPPHSDLPDAIDPEAEDTTYFRYNGYFRDRRAATRRAQDILSSARAMLINIAGKYSVVWEDPDPVRVSYLGPENCQSLSRKRTFVKLPHGLRVQWRDDTENDRELIVYRDGFDAHNATLFEVLELEGCDGDDMAWREGRYWFAVAEKRQFITTAIVGYEHLRFSLGSLVGVSHPVPKIGIQSGRLSGVEVNEAGNIVSVVLDEAVALDGENTYCVRIWLAKGANAYSTITNGAGEHRVLHLTNPITPLDYTDPDSSPKEGNYYQFGIEGYEMRDMLVKQITRRDDFHATVQLADAAPEIHLADQIALPETVQPPKAGDIPPPAAVTDLAVTEKVVRIGNSTQSSLALSWRPAEGRLVSSYQVYYALKDESPVFYAPVTTAKITIPVELQGKQYQVWVVAVSPSGNRLSIGESTSETLFVSGQLPKPATPANVRLAFANGSATISVDPQNDADLFELTIATPVSAGAALGGSLAASQTVQFAGTTATVPVPLAGTYHFTLRAVNFQGTASNAIDRSLTQSRAWARNAVASFPVSIDGGAFTGSIGRTDNNQIRRPSIVGTAWSIPDGSHDIEVFNGMWDLKTVSPADLTSLPPAWFVGPQLTETAEWQSDIIDFGEELTGVWWSDQKAEIVDFSGVINWADVPPSILTTRSPSVLKPDNATIGVELELGMEPDLSDARPVIGHFEGTARYGRIRVSTRSQSWVVEAYASDMTIHCDAPDEVDAGSGIIAANDTPQNITFSRKFAVVPTIVVVAEEDGTARLISNSVTKTGFQVSGVTGTRFTWHAQGVV